MVFGPSSKHFQRVGMNLQDPVEWHLFIFTSIPQNSINIVLKLKKFLKLFGFKSKATAYYRTFCSQRILSSVNFLFIAYTVKYIRSSYNVYYLAYIFCLQRIFFTRRSYDCNVDREL